MDINTPRSISHLNLWNTAHEKLTLPALKRSNDRPLSSSLHLVSSIPLTLYQQITSEAWLNLTPEAQDPDISAKLMADLPVELEIALKPDRLSQLVEQTDTPEEAIAHLQTLSQKIDEETSDDIPPLLQAENWYCTAIKQHQPTGEVGYQTLWHYLLPALQNPTSDAIANSITTYIQDQTAASLSQITQAADPLFQDIAQTFQDLFTGALADNQAASDSEHPAQTSLLDTLTDFFEAEDWPYAQLSASSSDNTTQTVTLRLTFRGENGQWPCYASINPLQQTFCFYSMSPITAQAEQQPAIAEFLTRANHGMILGNFELDYSDGEIRYKTSIDVEGDRLTFALIRNLVYANVMTVDQYLPGILAVLEQGMTPEQAIHLIEQGTSIAAPSETSRSSLHGR